MSKPTYDMLVQVLRKVKSNGTRLRYDTRDLVNSLLDAVDTAPIDPDEEQAADDQQQMRDWNEA